MRVSIIVFCDKNTCYSKEITEQKEFSQNTSLAPI